MIKRLAAILLLLVFLPVCAPAEEGVTLPEFSFADQHGRTWTLSDLEGRTVFLNFWTTWCPYCVQEMPDIEALYLETGANEGDVLILGIDTPETVDSADEAGIVAFLEERGLTYPTLIDPEADLMRFFGVTALPTTVLVGADGLVRFTAVGMMSPESMRELLLKAQP